MIKSMTGYGRGESNLPGKKFNVEMKAVNHRYSEVVLRMPRSLSQFEDRIRKIIQSRVARGRVDGFLSQEECCEKAVAVKVDKELAAAYYKAIKNLQESLDITGSIKIKYLTDLPGVMVVEEPSEDVEELWPAILEAVEAALESLIQMRETEGEQLASDLIQRIDRIVLLNKQIRERAPAVVEEYREKLRIRLNDFIKNGCLDPERLTAEAAVFADRSNITEETVRLESHLKQACACLQDGQPVGRKLDFIVQEMNREINTIGSKANDLEISRLVVEVKSEIEKIREQVQNLE